ncbi:MAG: hypothetical protein HOV68_29035 [Streptomycetaceae bacterium]|nr:hypothetical protein [Streptomycetaceae bacterium]
MDHVDITFPDGRTVRVTAQATPYGPTALTVRRGDRVVEPSGALREVGDGTRAQRGWTEQATHAIGRIPVRAADAERLRTLARAVQDRYDASPERQEQLLRRDRERLVERLSLLSDTESAARAAAFDAGELAGHLAPGGPTEHDSARVARAREELAAFDAEHPQIRAAVEARRKADVLRWMNQ